MANEIAVSVILESGPSVKSQSGVKNLISFEPHSSTQWTNDDIIHNCMRCSIEFTLLNRKHHCRYCGQIFCSPCSDFWIELPEHEESPRTKRKRRNSFHTTNPFSYYKYCHENKQRVCAQCYKNIFEFHQLSEIITLFDLIPLTLNEYFQIKLVCKSWYKIANNHIQRFKKIQFTLPHSRHTKQEQDMIINNRHLLAGHSIWLVQLLRVAPNHTLCLDILKRPKQMSCSTLRCKLQCKHALDAEAIVQCLYQKIKDPYIIEFLLQQLEQTPVVELMPYLSTIVFLIRFYKSHMEIVANFMTFLLQKAKHCVELSNQLFWELTLFTKDIEFQNFYLTIRKKLVSSLDKEQYQLFLKGYDFTHNMIEIVNSAADPKIALTKHLKNNNYQIHDNITLPINITQKFHCIKVDDIKTVNSKTKPLIIPCEYKDHSTGDSKVFRIMLKKDDIRKEAIVMNIIKLMDFYLKQDEQLDLNITTYNILPISNEYGYIEFVPNSYTLYNIREDRQFSIQNFIMEKNPNITAAQLRENFTKSCAAYCVITYLLGIGDRHLDNIMITQDAFIFNIDFGYIMGKDPKIMSPEFRLTTEMIDAMGGTESTYYLKFKDYCYVAYNCLRKHTAIFTILLSQLYSVRPPIRHLYLDEDYIHEQIMERFIPHENYKNATFFFKHKLTKNENNYTGSIIDFFHKKNKTLSEATHESPGRNSSQRVNQTATQLLDSAVHLTTSLTSNLKQRFKKMFW